jgi:hypothetical protein
MAIESEEDDFTVMLNVELTDRELYFIGRIVAAWGSLETVIFTQTLETLNPSSKDALPKAMNNLQPSLVHELWFTHVVEKATGERRDKLRKLHKKIEHLAQYRHAIVHGMWEWSSNELQKITVSRIRKDKLEILHLTSDDLMHLSMEVDKANWKIREQTDESFCDGHAYMSRKMAATLSDHPVAKEWQPYIKPEEK